MIAPKGTNAEALRALVDAGIRALSQEDRTTLPLRGLVHIPAGDYLAQSRPPVPTF